MTDPVKVLSDDALREIEARLRLARNPPGPTKERCTSSCGSSDEASLRHTYNSECRFGAKAAAHANFNEHARDDIDALCATVRALREQFKSMKSKVAWHRDGIGPDVPVLQERYDRLIAERNKLRADLERLQAKHNTLDTDFANEAKENTALREQLAECHDERWASQRLLTETQSQLAHWQERTRERTEEVEQLQSQLAQVTQERDDYANALESATKGIKCDD